MGEEGKGGKVVVELQLPLSSPAFNLTKSVCSHGLFMMAPNLWDPTTKTLQRPLRIPSSSSIIMVSVSQPQPHLLRISVLNNDDYDAHPTTFQDHEAVLVQVRRMLRISEENDRAVGEFHQMHGDAKERGFGRIFRSPTLFEDMVKCILLCNCQWSRTLSMARSLCELQLELQSHNSTAENFHPKTPQKREPKRKRGKGKKTVVNIETKYSRDASSMSNNDHKPGCQVSSSSQLGDFPTPEELANLDANFLAQRCKLGYRAQRIISLAKSIVDGTLQLRNLEQACDGYASSSYEEMDKQLSAINGFGPFTRANVLMCMGFYNRIPADSETIRHLKLVHSKRCTIKSVEKDAEAIYGKYGQFQFLAYWSELWNYYETRFGNLSEMPASDYSLITASNMRIKASKNTSR